MPWLKNYKKANTEIGKCQNSDCGCRKNPPLQNPNDMELQNCFKPLCTQ